MGDLIPFRPRPPTGAACAGSGTEVLPFPRPAAAAFAEEVRLDLARTCTGSFSPFLVRCEASGDGAETCRLSSGLVIGRDAGGRLWVGDSRTGFVNRGPFASVHEICEVVAWLDA